MLDVDTVSVSTKNNYIRVPRRLAKNFTNVERVELVRGKNLIGLALGEGDRKLSWQGGSAKVSFPKVAQEGLNYNGTKRFYAEIGRQFYKGKEIEALTINITEKK